MSQVGHADSKMTLDVYAQLEQRVDRSHGTSFDELIRTAGEQLDTLAPESGEAGFSPRIAHEGQNARSQARSTRPLKAKNLLIYRRSRNGETRTRTGDTTIFRSGGKPV